tara:strand:+ start:15442 stop:15585 length:144 start_codon:yes stop_codon:yes gene_type:complete
MHFFKKKWIRLKKMDKNKCPFLKNLLENFENMCKKWVVTEMQQIRKK